MNLAAEDIWFIKEHIGEWLAEQSLSKPPVVYETELRERMVHIENELKHQRELIKTILEQMDKRFEAIQPERRHFLRNPKWGPSDFGCKKSGDGHGLRRPMFVLRPSRRALRAAPGLPQ